MKEFLISTALILFLTTITLNVMADCGPVVEECGPEDDLTGC